MNLDRQQLSELRKSLEIRYAALQAEIQGDRTKAQVLVSQERDRREPSGGLADLQVADAELGRDWQEVGQIQAALDRMDRGLYGDCIVCGKTVGLKRLIQSPAAARCMHCQEAVERGATRNP